MINFSKKVLRKIFVGLQNIGVNILPNHFYSNIPHISRLKSETFWRERNSMVGVRGADVEEQFAFVKDCHSKTGNKEILTNNELIRTARQQQKEDGFGPVEADFLYCLINAVQPKKIIQIGAGVSTAIMRRAAKDVDYPLRITCVEPYPSKYIKTLNDREEIRLIPEIAQKVPLDILTDLEEGDLFFVDSTHTVKTGSEVNRIILEVLPRLNTGVFVHFHDIFFPYDYQRNVLGNSLFFWEETTLLHAFLIHNSRYAIKASLSMLHYDKKKELQQLFPNYIPQEEEDGLSKGDTENKHFPSSTYLQVI